MNFTTPQLITSSSTAFESGVWDPRVQEPAYDLSVYDEDHGNLLDQEFQALHPVHSAFNSFTGLTAQEITDVSDDFLFGHGEDDEIKALMAAPILEVVSPNEPIKSGYAFSIDEAIHNVSPAPSKEASPKRRNQGCDREDSPKRFRSYQSGNWAQRFKELCEYRQKHGNCLISHTYAANLPLARWVKRQRYQYKLLTSGQPSTMIPERVRALEDIGFCWGSQESAWSERFEELLEFKSRFGHTNVPSLYAENPQLATWIKCQRRNYKLFKHESTQSNITLQRINKLDEIDFEWELKNSKNVLVSKKH